MATSDNNNPANYGIILREFLKEKFADMITNKGLDNIRLGKNSINKFRGSKWACRKVG